MLYDSSNDPKNITVNVFMQSHVSVISFYVDLM